MSGTQQDRNHHMSVPPAGPGLLAALDAGKRDGRPVWHVPGVDALPGFAVPKLTCTAEHQANQVRMPFVKGPKDDERRRLQPEVYVLLNDPNAAAWALLYENQTAQKQLTHLIAAAYRDVRGWTIDNRAEQCNITDLLGYGCADTAKRAIHRGRLLWAALSAWPWWRLGNIGKLHHAPPNGWAAVPRVADEFAFWRDPAAYRAWERAAQHAA